MKRRRMGMRGRIRNKITSEIKKGEEGVGAPPFLAVTA
jgi:hypothetical protein